MNYSIEIAQSARREWKKLDHSIKQQFQKKLDQLTANPKIPSAKLRGYKDAYRIKLRDAGYRLIYRVIDEWLIIVIVTVAKRDSSKKDVYHLGEQRLKDSDV